MLTQAQLIALKADIAADPVLSLLPINDDTSQQIADAYNQPALVDYWVWRSSVTKSELVSSVGPDGTTFNWTGNGFITRSVGELTAWQEIFNGSQSVNPSRANVRAAFADIFSGGTGNAPANRIHLLAVSRRKTTRAEKLFAVGSGTTVAPGTMMLEGQLSRQEVRTARELP